jgi:hypothetical protein
MARAIKIFTPKRKPTNLPKTAALTEAQLSTRHGSRSTGSR